jgi:Chaperone of endosialidase
MNSFTHVKKAASVFIVGWLCFGLLPTVQAVSPDGCLPGGNTAEGCNALLSLTTGTFNTAVGFDSLLSNTDANFNTGVGAGTLLLNTADGNTATGAGALLSNSTGQANTANGEFALFNNSTGSGNIAIGVNAGINLTTSDNNIDIGNEGDASDSDTIRIGNASHGRIFIPAIKNIVLGAGVPVTIDSTTGLLGIATSSLRFKQNIKPMDKSSEAILALKPVTFRYNQKIDPKAIPQFGLVAEDVEKVSPDLVVRDKEGKPYSVRYEAVNAMLLNEFLKEHRKVEQLTKDFESKLAEQQRQIEALTAGLQKASAQFEVSKPAPQVVKNP